MRLRICFVLSFVLLAASASAELVHSWDEALALATEKELPIVVDFWADWCGPCKRFDADSANDEALRATLDKVVLFKTDAERGGKDLAAEYLVKGYPTYMVTNAAGETLGRWWGYEDAENWVGRFEDILADPTTMTQKAARFVEKPNTKDAVTLAEFHESRQEFEEAVEYYEQALALDPAESRKYEDLLFYAVYSATRFKQMDYATLASRADVIVARGEEATDDDLYYVARYMVAAARRADVLPSSAKYLIAAKERLSSVAADDESAQQALDRLQIDYALIVDRNEEQAVALKRATYGEGWLQDPDAMNGFAWWCFENKLNLEEAEQIARDAVELATDITSKVQILDTAAEICNARGDCRDAVLLMQQALELDPENARSMQQLERFQKILETTG